MPPVATRSQWSNVQLQALWHQLEPQSNPFTHILAIDGVQFRHLDAGAKKFIAHRYMSQIGEAVMFCRDGTGPDRYFLGPPRIFVANDGIILWPIGCAEAIWMKRVGPGIEQPETVSARPEKIRRPPNAYILYRKERHHLVKEANPGITNNEISQILGKAWNLESREVRFKYKEMSEKIKKELLEKHPNYQYKPRRPSEKRRRRCRHRVNPTQDHEDEELDDGMNGVAGINAGDKT